MRLAAGIMIGKPRDMILADMQRRLQDSIPELKFGPGSVVRAILSSVTDEIAMGYETLDYAVRMTDLSTAHGQYLDLLGQLVGIYRNEGEGDNVYRARIAASESIRAGANETAIRFECLAQPLVRDVVFHKWSHGPGSCTIYVIPVDREFDGVALASVRQVIDHHAAAGVRFNIVLPRDIVIDLSLVLIFTDNAARRKMNAVVGEVRTEIAMYVANLLPGSTFRDTDIIRLVRNVSSEIIDMDVISFAVDGTKRAFGDIKASWNERFAIGKLRIK